MHSLLQDNTARFAQLDESYSRMEEVGSSIVSCTCAEENSTSAGSRFSASLFPVTFPVYTRIIVNNALKVLIMIATL